MRSVVLEVRLRLGQEGHRPPAEAQHRLPERVLLLRDHFKEVEFQLRLPLFQKLVNAANVALRSGNRAGEELS